MCPGHMDNDKIVSIISEFESDNGYMLSYQKAVHFKISYIFL